MRVLNKLPGWIAPPGAWRPWAAIAICSGLELLAIRCAVASVFSSHGISWAGKVTILLVPPLFWLAISWLLFWYVSGLRRIAANSLPRWSAIWLTMATAPVSICLVLYVVSWLFFLRTGVLPDADVFRFMFLNLTMLGKYFWQAERHVLYEFAALLVIATGASSILLRQLQLSWRSPTTPVSFIPLVFVSWTLLNLILLPVAFGKRPSSPVDRVAAYQQSDLPLAYELTRRVNPVVAWASPLMLWETSDIAGAIPARMLIPRTREVSKPSVTPDRPAPNQAAPNILIIVVESLRADVLGKVHQNREVTPNLNRLGRTGTSFTRAYSQSVHSDYSDPAIVSSLYPLRTSGQHFYRRAVPWPKVLLWDVFKPNGYATSIFSSQNEAWSNMHLFYESKSLDVLFDSRSSKDQSFNPLGDVTFAKWRDATGLAGKLNDRLTSGSALEWITRQEAARRPWLCVMNFQTSHFPYQLPKGNAGPFHPSDLNFQASLLSWDVKHVEPIRNAYFNALDYIDKRIGEIVQRIAELDATRRTIIVVTGDHGEAMGEAYEVGHAQSLIESACRVPLVFHCPGRVPAATSNYLAQAIDIAPTALGLAGFEIPDAFQGIDLFSENRLADNERIVFLTCRAGGVGSDAIVSALGWKLMHYQNGQMPVLYFRPTGLEVDNDFAKDYPEVVTILQQHLRDWRTWQLLYHRDSRYHELFYAPRTPQLTQSEVLVLAAAADKADKTLGK